MASQQYFPHKCASYTLTFHLKGAAVDKDHPIDHGDDGDNPHDEEQGQLINRFARR